MSAAMDGHQKHCWMSDNVLCTPGWQAIREVCPQRSTGVRTGGGTNSRPGGQPSGRTSVRRLVVLQCVGDFLLHLPPDRPYHTHRGKDRLRVVLTLLRGELTREGVRLSVTGTRAAGRNTRQCGQHQQALTQRWAKRPMTSDVSTENNCSSQPLIMSSSLRTLLDCQHLHPGQKVTTAASPCGMAPAPCPAERTSSAS
ncbi:uncharacterized protein LOC121620571 isoform X2 [Chelmon rostratus]|nr:uncharacterized protein LOC121620571 isoform X2 [Chelmon rostratus]